MTRIFRLSLLSILLLLPLLAACQVINPEGTPTPFALPTPASPTSVAPAPVSTGVPAPTEQIVQGTVTIWHSLDEPKVPALVQVIQDFQAQYPDVQFDVLYVPGQDLKARFETESREGSGPDILLGPAEWGPVLFDKGLISDISSFAGSGMADRFSSPALGSVQYRQALIGLPYAIRGVVLYRNKLLIPGPPATFDELVAMAKRATQGDKLGADLERSFFFSGGHLEGLGGKLMQEDGSPAFNDEKGIAWIELLKAFEQAGATEYLSDRDLELFKEGRVGWIIDGTWNMDDLAKALGSENLAIDPWPLYQDGALSGYVQSDNLYLSAGVDEQGQQAAWKFMEHFTSPSAQATLGQVGFIPAIKGIQDEFVFTNPLLSQAIVGLEGGVTYSPVPEIANFSTPLDIALRSILAGGLLPSDGLKAAEDSILEAQGNAQATPPAASTTTPSP